MHPLQRRSLFAILTIAESAIQQMRAILAQDTHAESMPVSAPSRVEPRAPSSDIEYMTTDEDDAFEKQLEEDRRQMMEDDAKRMTELWGAK